MIGRSFECSRADTVGSNALIAVVNCDMACQIHKSSLTRRIRNIRSRSG